jgi:hypothetical protein
MYENWAPQNPTGLFVIVVAINMATVVTPEILDNPNSYC